MPEQSGLSFIVRPHGDASNTTILNTPTTGVIDMVLCRVLIPILVIVCLAFQASSQGYAGTTTTGTGIVPPLNVGSGAVNDTGAGNAAAIGSAITVGSTTAMGSTAAIGSAIAIGSVSATGSTTANGSTAAIGSAIAVGSVSAAGSTTAIGSAVAVGSTTAIGSTNAIGSAASQANLAGAWSMDLKDSKIRHLELNMQQNGNALTGYGNITADNGNKKVTASGSLSGSGIDLSVSAVDASEMYKLALTESGTSITGGYNAQSTDGSVWSGTATGSVGSSTSEWKSPVMLGMDLSQLQTADVRSSALTSESDQGATSSGSDHTISSRSFSSTYSQGQVSTSDVTTSTSYS
jgi:hypothetical protein